MTRETAAKKIDPAEIRQRIARYHAELAKRNHFELLSVERESDLETLRGNYHQLAKQWHTDAYPTVDLGPEKQKLHEIFQRIGEAYETLTTPELRSEYIVMLDRKAQGLSTDVSSILRAEQLVDDAVANIRKRNWADARTGLEEAMELNRDDALFQVHLGWVVYNEKKGNAKASERAIELLKGAVLRQESLPLAYQYLGQIHFQLDQYAEARKWWKKCLQWDRKNIEATRGLRLMNTRSEKKKGGLAGIWDKLTGKKS